MFVLPIQISETEYNIYFVLQQENLDRMKAYDPAQLEVPNLPGNYRGLTLRTVLIMFATDEEANRLETLMRTGKTREGLKALYQLSRGFQFDPGRGDTDDPYESLAHLRTLIIKGKVS
jgi:hypothetical protein